MKKEYIVDNEYLIENEGLNLDDYMLDGAYVYIIIKKGLGIVVDRFCELDDSIKSELKLEEYLSKSDETRTSEEKVFAFKKAQGRVIWNLVFAAETSPVDQYIDSILVQQLGAKINAFQKGLHYKNNR